MALTIIQSPPDIAPAGNPIIFLLNTTNSAQPNFRFIAEIKNSGGAVLAKRKFPLLPGTTKGWIDIHNLLQSYVSHDFSIDLAASAESSSSVFQYSVSFGEEYGTTITEYLNLAASGSLKVWNASLQEADEAYGFNLDHWKIVDPVSPSARWLSVFGSSKRIALDQRDFLSFLTNGTGSLAPTAIKVTAVASGGGTTSSMFSVSASSGHRMLRIPSGPANLNLISSLISGTPGAIIPADTARYYIQARKQATNTDFGPIFEYQVKDPLSVYDPWDIFFLNRFGALEGFRMEARSDISRKIERKVYEKPLLEFDGSLSVGFSPSSGSITPYSTEISSSLSLNSGWLTESENEALLDLVSSPLVYSYQSGKLREIAIQTADHRVYKKVNDKLAQLQLSASFAIKDRRQTR